MRILLSAFSFLFLFPAHLLAQGESEIRAYIEQYKDLAIAEQIRVGVPAAITLAQGIHESSAGLSELATKGNNHFGIKCKSTWTGMTILHDDDKKQECFRKYTSSEQSYIDHSEFLKGSNRYHFLFDLDKTDYQGWASGLKRAGYATNPAYVQKLTDLVEKFNLQQYTYEALSKTKIRVGETVPEKDAPRNLTYIEDPASSYKGLKGFWAKKGETLLSYATDRNIRYARLLALNDLNDEALPINMFIFTEKKRRMGTEEFHVVKENENMLIISQKEAMLLSALYEFNNLQPGQEPLPGERLCLQYRSYETPKIKQQFLNELPVSQDNKPRESVVVIREETAPAKKTK
ncbi:MAG TPA: glucosaminidase domain-containing protein, partial [Chitinophagaceae bacterium]|nr:glucosaminidase domain-containing protein [Chitinophagaceae bacterium]